MTTQIMKIPVNGTTRLSRETWVEAEMLKRYSGAESVRKVIEQLVKDALTEQIGIGDSEFLQVMKEVREEGVEK